MDLFGIGLAIQGMTEMYFRGARGAGRTISMIESVQDGDRIIFVKGDEARRVERLLKERNKDVACITIPPSKNPMEILGTSQGRTVFDHSWVEEFYLRAIDRTAKDINYFQENLSGFGTPHIETRRMAKEAARWRL